MNHIELYLFGIAALVDLALMLALRERVNRGRVAVWMTLLIASASIVHGGVFLRLLIDDSAVDSFRAYDRVLESAVCLGLLVIPSAMLHAAIRLNHSGLDPHPPRDKRYRWLYCPVLIWPLVTVGLWNSTANNFIDDVGIWRNVYLIWIAIANCGSVFFMLRIRRRRLGGRSDSFSLHLSILIAAITALAIVYGVFTLDTRFESIFRVASTLSPLVAVFLFVWHSTRGRLLPLVLERTFVYAAIMASLLFTHRVFVSPLASYLRAKTGIDFAVVEWIGIAALVLLVPTLRDRVAGSLRQLFSVNFVQVRHAIRQVSLKLSQNATRDTPELVRWFAAEVRQSLELDYVVVVLDGAGADGKPIVTKVDSSEVSATESGLTKSIQLMHRTLNDSRRVLELGALDNDQLEQAFLVENALLAYRLSYRSITGMVCLGNRLRNDRIAGELVEVFALVVDQFAATLHNRREETLRGLAERKILQQEKLSALGLLSGSLAHELRNPLSSIRTISTLVLEELGQGHECARDLKLIVSEIDRLSSTANRLLEFAKPEQHSLHRICPDEVIRRVIFVLDFLARQHGVRLNLALSCKHELIACSEASLSEIVFNLVKNAIEAAKEVEEGQVEVISTCIESRFSLAVRDNGNGISNERRTSLFQPFATYKPDGTGLGLYAVNERVRELGGSIQFFENEPRGTVFNVSLPLVGRDGYFGR